MKTKCNGLVPVFVKNENENEILISTILRNATDFGTYKVAKIPIFLLNMAAYQRKLQEKRVAKIASEWDPYCAKDILVSYREGKFWVVDGQHTTAAAKKVGMQDIQCKIRTGLTYEQEAKLFAEQGDNVKRPSVRERHSGLVEAGNTDAVFIKDICAKYNITTQTIASGNPYLRSVSDANAIVSMQGKEAFEWVMDTIVKCGWRHDAHAFSSCVLRTMRLFYGKYTDNDKIQNRLVNVLKNKTPLSCAAEAVAAYPTKTKESAFKQYVGDLVYAAY